MTDASSVTPLEREAADTPITFDFAGETWEIVDGFKTLVFERMAEDGKITRALEYALGAEQYEDLADIIEKPTQLWEMSQAIGEAVAGATPGESRASRRSSAKRPRR